MDQKRNDHVDENNEEFLELLEGYQYEHPKRGQLIEGEIKSVAEDNIILDIGAKRAAIVTTREVKKLDEEVENLSIGDVIPVQVMRTPIGDENLLVSLEGAREYKNWESIHQLLKQDATLELEVIGHNRGGLLVRYEQLEGFVPNSLTPTLRKINNRKLQQDYKQELVGSTLTVKPIEVNRKEQKLVLSAMVGNNEMRQKRLEELEVGSIVEGLVINLVKFGAFIELGGVDGLLHISEMDWKNVEHPSEVVSIGDSLQVKVIQIDRDRSRVSLSRKALLPNPWQEVGEAYQPGDLLEVKIVNLVDFGAFAELPEGIQGLIHVSELGYTAADDMEESIQVGETVQVKILDLDVERERVSLSMKQLPADQQKEWTAEHRPESENSG
jgi:ribosomal protein S1